MSALKIGSANDGFLKEVQQIIEVDSSFTDDNSQWSIASNNNNNKQGVYNNLHDEDAFSDDDNDELIFITSPKKVKNQEDQRTLVLQNENKLLGGGTIDTSFSSDAFDEAVDIILESKMDIIEKKAARNLFDETYASNKKRKMEIPPWELPSSPCSVDEQCIEQLENNQLNTNVAANDFTHSGFKSPPRFQRSSTKLTSTSTTTNTDESPSWHSRETWYKMKNSNPNSNSQNNNIHSSRGVDSSSSPVIQRNRGNRRNPIIVRDSSSPASRSLSHSNSLKRKDLQDDNPENLNPVIGLGLNFPISKLKREPQILTKSMLDLKSPYFGKFKTLNVPSKRFVSTEVSSRNSTIELSTQKPHMNDLASITDYNYNDREKTKNLQLNENADAQSQQQAQNPAREQREQQNQAEKTKPKAVKPILLSEEQVKVIELAKQGISLFYTGSAGTGKSVLLRSLIKTLREQHGRDSVAVTASTGLAACNIGGSTLHSFAGIGLGNGDVDSLMRKIKRSKNTVNRWRNIRVLVIDEISMIDCELLDKLNEIAKRLRSTHKPFGGVQLIVCGDFYQLPPVSKDATNPAKFAFESDSWKECVQTTIILQKVFRQQGDAEFIDLLNEIRRGIVTNECTHKFSMLRRPLKTEDGIEAAELYPTRSEVDKANSTRLEKIKEPVVKYEAIDSGSIEDYERRQKMLNNFLAPRILHLKKNAQVMMIKNIDETLVNGSLGKIIDFVDPDTYLFYEETRKNPLKVEDSDIIKTIERTKGKKPDRLRELVAATEVINGNRGIRGNSDEGLDETVFDFFKNYESSSTSDPLLLADFKRKKELINSLYSESKGRRLPLVRFLLSDGNTRDVLVEPELFEIEDPADENRPLASRKQLPLILAWALSIHKSQGQTLNKVKVDLRKIFEKGQAYVALSRATSREGLQVLNFTASKIMTHHLVVDFYDSLKGVDDAIKGLKNNEISEDDEEKDNDYAKLTKREDNRILFEKENDSIEFEDSETNYNDSDKTYSN